MPPGHGRIFAAGIVWDPREPLPPEFRGKNQCRKTQQQFRLGRQVDDAEGGPSYIHYDSNYPGRSPDVDAFATSAAKHVGPEPMVLFGAVAPAKISSSSKSARIPSPIPAQQQEHQEKEIPAFTVQEWNRNVLPPLSISLDASIVQDTARVTVEQTFWNDCNRLIKEASYTSPLPAGCTVTDFTCRIGTNKIIKGSVRPKKEARQAFEQHIRTKDTGAALLEQDTTEVFTTVLGNIPSKTKIRVHLSYITLLKHHFEDRHRTTTLAIPTYLASRYGSPPDDLRDTSSTNVPQGLTLKAEVVESTKVRSISSLTHKIAVERRLGKENADDFADLAGEGNDSKVEVAVVTLATGSMFLDRDFSLDIVTDHGSDRETAQAWLEEHPTIPGHRALMLTLPPKYFGQASSSSRRKGEILFLADRSGSMEDKIDSLKSAMVFFLKGIPEGRKFNIWSFGSSYSSWEPKSVKYSDSSLESALSYVSKRFRANKGGTEILPAVRAIVEARDKSMMTDIIILTDGQTWRLDETLEYIQMQHKRTEGRVRFFSLGIGDGVSHALVEGIAKAGGGYAEVIPASVREGWEDRVVSMLKAALTTEHLGPLFLEFEYQGKKGKAKSLSSARLPEAGRSPADIATLTPFNHNRVYFLLDPKQANRELESVTITGATGSNTSKSVVVPIVRLEKKDTTVHKLAARAILEDLERGKSHLHIGPNKLYPGTQQEKSSVRQEAEAIACKWSLVSKWTSFFLVEEPYEPKGDDLFMDNIIEVTESAGDDLLQPRGDAKTFAGSLDALPSSASATSSGGGLNSLGSSSTNPGPRIGGLVSIDLEDEAEEEEDNGFYVGAYQLRCLRRRSGERRDPPPPSGIRLLTQSHMAIEPSGLAIDIPELSIWPNVPYHKSRRRVSPTNGSDDGYGRKPGGTPRNASDYGVPSPPPPSMGVPMPPPPRYPMMSSKESTARVKDQYESIEARALEEAKAAAEARATAEYEAKKMHLEEQAKGGDDHDHFRLKVALEREKHQAAMAAAQEAEREAIEMAGAKGGYDPSVMRALELEARERQEKAEAALKAELNCGVKKALELESQEAKNMEAALKADLEAKEKAKKEAGMKGSDPSAWPTRDLSRDWTYRQEAALSLKRLYLAELQTEQRYHDPETLESLERQKDEAGQYRGTAEGPAASNAKQPSPPGQTSYGFFYGNQDASSSESLEGFVYDSNPPDGGDRPHRFHSRTPKATMAGQADEQGTRSIHTAIESPSTPIIIHNSMKFANSYNGNWDDRDRERKGRERSREEREREKERERLRKRLDAVQDDHDEADVRPGIRHYASSRMGSYVEPLGHAVPRPRVQVLPPRPPYAQGQKQAQTDFVREIIGYQRSNGSFNFNTDTNAEACLGRDVVSKVAELKDALGWGTAKVFVAIVIVLLRRDFQSCKSYWELMESKAVEYLKSEDRALGEVRGSYKHGLTKTEQVLEGVSVRIGHASPPTRGMHPAVQVPRDVEVYDADVTLKRPTGRNPRPDRCDLPQQEQEVDEKDVREEEEEEEESDNDPPRELVTHAPID